MKTPNYLSNSLHKAINQAEHRPQFYQDFYEATLYIVHHPDNDPIVADEHDVTCHDQSLSLKQIQINDTWFVPVFTSPEAMLAILDEPIDYLAIPAKNLLLMLEGMHWYLDYGSPISKSFHADELAAIANGSIGQCAHETVINEDCEVLLGEPTEYPDALAQALLAFLPKQMQVNRAWLAMIFNPNDGLPPHTVLALEATGDMATLTHQIGQYLQSCPIPNPPLDILPLGSGAAIDDYFLSDSQAFYQAV